MATKFLDPGGDAGFILASPSSGGFWDTVSGVTVVSDFVHGTHAKSLKVNNFNFVAKSSAMVDAGGRVSFYMYVNALPSVTYPIFEAFMAGLGGVTFQLKITSTGVLQLFESTAQIGSNGSTLQTGQWYRISIAYTISSTTVNRFEIFKDGASDISVTNATITNTGSDTVFFGSNAGNAAFDIRVSDIYVDNSSSLTDTGNIWVAAKRPLSNGSANNFATQIGAGGSSYGSGHAQQVNERPVSTTNGWSMIGAGSAVTEEYTIEGVSVGDLDLKYSRFVDYMGWVYASSLASETAQIVVGGIASNIALTSAATAFVKFAGSTSYPAGGTDIGIITATDLTTVSLYECGIVIAYIPPPTPPTSNFKSQFKTPLRPALFQPGMAR